MEKIKKIIMTLIILIVFIILGIIIYIKSSNVSSEMNIELKEQENLYINLQNNPASVVNGKKPVKVKYANIYYTIFSLVEDYIKYVNEKNSQAVYNILDEEYINENNINLQNVVSIIKKYNNESNFKVEDMYELSGINYSTYYIKGYIDKEYIFISISTDFSNKTFSILPLDQKEYENRLETISENVEGEEKKIEVNPYNIFNYLNVSEEKMCEYLLQDYVTKSLYDIERAYEILEKDYKKERFGSLNSFKEYVKDNQSILKRIDKSDVKKYSEINNEQEYEKYLEELDKISLSKYLVESTESGIRYICIDNYENYYIFDTKAVMDYTLTLDTYTIQSEKFKAEYNNGSNQKKVQLNIDKFIKMINNKDYTHAYELLDEGFKNNYFKTEEDFKKFIKSRLFEFNNLTFDNFSEEGETYIYKVTLTDKTLKNNNKINMNIIMQLKGGTDFVMSFGKAE